MYWASCMSVLILGLSLLAMCLSMIQEGMSLKAENFARKMGFGNNGLVSLDVVTIKERQDQEWKKGLKMEFHDNVEDQVSEEATEQKPTRPASAVSTPEGGIPGSVEDIQEETEPNLSRPASGVSSIGSNDVMDDE